MTSMAMVRQSSERWTAPLLGLLSLLAASCAPAVAGGVQPAPAAAGREDPRIGLRPGWTDAGEAIRNLEMIAHRPRPEGFFNPADLGDFGFANTDMAFQGNLLFLGSYNGFQVWDISNPSSPRLRSSLVCPGGQGDLSVYGDLLFMSVEETRGRVDCGAQGVSEASSPERFRGVRIFDISNLDQPRQVAAIQTCRGSHTHTLVTDPNDPANLYVYISGTAGVRGAAELPGCSGAAPGEDPNTAFFRIEVVKVPLAAPQQARIVNMPRIFADPTTGNIAGLWRGGEQGPGAQRTAQTNQCHDITAYPAVGLAAGACAGNGILLDIRNPANPVRIEETFDPNFAYWHSATFDNEGTKVLFTDEWGGGAAPRCRETDRPEWGANAIFRIADGELRPASYYKLPAPQTALENCVAHNGNLIPVPGRDIMVQAWYQGGISVFDWTDPANPVEIAFFDRGPLSAEELILGGYWSSYWYNGAIYGSEIGRGLDVFRLVPSQYLSQNEIEAAKLAVRDRENPQLQQPFVWPASFVVARAYLDQLRRNGALPAARLTDIDRTLAQAEALPAGAQRRTALTQLATQLERDVPNAQDAARVRALAGVVKDLASRDRP